MNAPAFDLDPLRAWIGRTHVAHDTVSPRRARELMATLDIESGDLATADLAPLAIHWCLAPPAVATAALGPDGHPPRGDFLPPVPLPRRMWASGVLHFTDRLRIGDVVERRSRIANVAAKSGRSGDLCFVTLDHEILTARGLAIAEQQTIVYRAAEPAATSLATPGAIALPTASAEHGRYRDLVASTALLFRYSALTFNAHRIHYDRDYARDVEGYPGLVVQGPLLATQLLEFAAADRGAAPAKFTFRALGPVFDNVPYRLCARDDAGRLLLWIETGDGKRTTEAEAGW
ncbi:MAG: hypothetical protein JWO16_118 [Sphingomonas bacterium]|jgi:3-methylfumaryl-CoA hydratase|nr:hypothetical protein [Sphingomonas bacterium]